MQATMTRRYVIGISVVMAFVMYLHRLCLGEIVKTDMFQEQTGLSKEQIGSVLGAFFFTYALLQVPAGWIGDRFGARRILTASILVWSLLTAATGFAYGALALLVLRLGVGMAQAGAYPSSSSIVRNWVPVSRRGKASGLIAFGGRVGGAASPFLTMLFIQQIGWRATLVLYGVIGVGLAMTYFALIRDRPADPPDSSQAEPMSGSPAMERRKINVAKSPRFGKVLLACCGSRSLWLNSLCQFCVNVGWVFLVTWLPTYLKEAKQVSDAQGALMVSMALAVGMLGQLIGGATADWSVKSFGLRYGRVLPISLANCIAATAYLSCLLIDSAWGIVACCAVVSLMTDFANPSMWAFVQDVGGRNTGAIFGWPNMWGNLGAAACARMVPWVMAYGAGSTMGQDIVFVACGSAFFIAAVAALGMDATKRLLDDHEATRDQ